MSSILFAGPSLSGFEIPSEVVLCGPARCGDVLRAANEGFSTILLVDGYFDQCLPVWHKEILWALTQGITVVGASSMGALRAAELHPYGMLGVGRIFEAYRDGLLTDDDEVTMAHGDATTSYRPLSTPLVNIRVTLSTACSDGVFSRETAEHYLDLAKRRFYPERSYGQLLADAKIVAELEQTVADFARWLGPQFERAIDQKRIDAALLLETVTNNDLPAAEAEPFAFAHTEAFHELRKRTGSQRVPRSR